MIGIYKITSPTKRVYIGQSINILRRWNGYKKNKAKGQFLLQKSLEKYGAINHQFEILCECEISELNDKERYYQDLFNVMKNGLNCKLTKSNDKSGKLSEESRLLVGRKKITNGDKLIFMQLPIMEKDLELIGLKNLKIEWKKMIDELENQPAK